MVMGAHFTLAVALVCAGAPLSAADTCEKEFASAEAFESEVMDDEKVWAVVFHSSKKGQPAWRHLPAGATNEHFCNSALLTCVLDILSVDPEGLGEAANGLMSELDGKVKVGCFDYKLSKDLAGEFGVRKFNLPQVRRTSTFHISIVLGAHL